MALEILAVIVQIVGFVVFCRLGARLSSRLYKRSKWAPLAAAAPIMAGLLMAVFFVQPPLTFIPQTFGLWLLAFAGGLVVWAQQQYRGE